MKMKRFLARFFGGRYVLLKKISVEAGVELYHGLQMNGKNNVLCVVRKVDVAGSDFLIRENQSLIELRSDFVPVPLVMDFVEDAGQVYQVTEAVPGARLDKVVKTVYAKKVWFRLTKSEKMVILEYYWQVLQFTEMLHARRHTFRKLGARDFKVVSLGRLQITKLDYVPFDESTNGAVAVRSDYYQLGKLLQNLLSGLPVKEGHIESEYGIEKTRGALKILTCSDSLVKLVIRLLSPDPELRPDLKEQLEVIYAEMKLLNLSIEERAEYAADKVSNAMRVKKKRRRIGGPKYNSN